MKTSAKYFDMAVGP